MRNLRLIRFKFLRSLGAASLLKFHSASAVEIYLKQFVIFVVRVNLTRIALLMPLVDFGFGILPTYAAFVNL